MTYNPKRNCYPKFIGQVGTHRETKIEHDFDVTLSLQVNGRQLIEDFCSFKRSFKFHSTIKTHTEDPHVYDMDIDAVPLHREAEDIAPGLHGTFVEEYDGSISENFTASTGIIRILDLRNDNVVYSKEKTEVTFNTSSHDPVGYTQVRAFAEGAYRTIHVEEVALPVTAHVNKESTWLFGKEEIYLSSEKNFIPYALTSEITGLDMKDWYQVTFYGAVPSDCLGDGPFLFLPLWLFEGERSKKKPFVVYEGEFTFKEGTTSNKAKLYFTQYDATPCGSVAVDRLGNIFVAIRTGSNTYYVRMFDSNGKEVTAKMPEEISLYYPIAPV